MGSLEWSPSSLKDVEDLVTFIARDSPRYAQKMYDRLINSPDRLAGNLRLGGKVPEFDRDDLREIWVRPYRVIYRIRGETASILAVVHGSRDLTRILKRDEIE